MTERRRAALLANLARAGALTPDGRERLRRACRRNRPWQYATGPRTAAGKRRCRMNAHRTGEHDAGSRVAAAILADLGRLLDAVRAATGGRGRRGRASALRRLRQALFALPLLRRALPDAGDIDAATAWLRERRAARRPG